MWHPFKKILNQYLFIPIILSFYEEKKFSVEFVHDIDCEVYQRKKNRKSHRDVAQHREREVTRKMESK